MLAIISALVGFGSNFLPKVFEFFQNREDNKHEREMMKLRIEASAQEHLWRMEEISSKADIEEARELHKPQPSYGVQFLDALQNQPRYLYVPLVYLFAFMDFTSGMVRSIVTYAVVGGYLLYKWSRYQLMQQVSDESFQWYEGVVKLWDEQDYAILTLVLGFWFGARMYKAVFGGNASHGEKGK